MLREARCVESGISNLVEWIVLVRHDGRKGDDLLTFTEDPPADRAIVESSFTDLLAEPRQLPAFNQIRMPLAKSAQGAKIGR